MIETIEFETLDIPKWFNLILCVLKQYFGRWRLAEITRMMIEGFIKERLQSKTVRKETVAGKRVHKTRSPTTVRKEVALLAQVFNHARQERLINYNPCDEIGKAIRKKIPALVRRQKSACP